MNEGLSMKPKPGNNRKVLILMPFQIIPECVDYSKTSNPEEKGSLTI